MGNLRNKYTDEEWESLQNKTTHEIDKSYVIKEVYKCLNTLSNSVGETITEYHWREFCGLMKIMEDSELISKVDVIAIIEKM